jgi:hypothetical protein
LREREVLDTIARLESVKMAAEHLGVSVRTLYNMLYRMRAKQEMWRRGINILLSYRKKSPLLDKVLRRRIRASEEVEIGKEDEISNLDF